MYLSTKTCKEIGNYGPEHFCEFAGCPKEEIEFVLEGFYIDEHLVVMGQVRFKDDGKLCWRRAKRILTNKDAKGWYNFSAKIDKDTLKIAG